MHLRGDILQVCLPVEYPPITSFPSIANLLSILWVHKERTLPWICDHYVQLIIRPNHPVTRSDFYDQADTDNFIINGYFCPFLGWLRNNQTTARFTDFTDYIEYQINHGYYMDACLDRFFLSCSNCYNSRHFIHQSFIYGYDNDKKQVFISDFFDSGKYERKIVSYEEINNSIKGIDYHINLYKYQDCNYEINLDLLKLSIADYLNCRDSLKKFQFSNPDYNKNVLYGLDLYNYVIDVFCNEKHIDIRPFHILYDHKKMMKIRLDYLKKLNIFDSIMLELICKRNDSLIEKSLLLRNKVIKYNLKHNNDLLSKIKTECRDLKNNDYYLFSDLLRVLS